MARGRAGHNRSRASADCRRPGPVGGATIEIETAPQLEREATADLEIKREELRRHEADVEQRRTEWVRDHQEAETKLKAFREQYAELKEQRERIARLGEDGACPTCTRPLGDHYKGVLDDLDAKLDTLSVDGKYYKNRLEQLEETAAALKQLEDARRLLAEELAKLDRRCAKIQAAVQELGQLTRELEAKHQRHEQLRRELASIPSGYDKTRHEHLQHELARLKPLARKRPPRRAGRSRGTAQNEQFRAGRRAAEIRERAAGLRARRDAAAFSEQKFAELRATTKVVWPSCVRPTSPSPRRRERSPADASRVRRRRSSGKSSRKRRPAGHAEHRAPFAR